MLSQNLMMWLSVLAWGVCAAGLAAYAAAMAKEITYVTLADGRRQERSIPILFRMLLPFVPNLSGFVARPFFDKSRNLADEMLVSAGFEGLLNGGEFVALKILMPVVGGVFWALFVLLLGALLPDSIFTDGRGMLIFGGVMLLYFQPVMWLRSALKQRHLSIMRALPFVLDLLTLSVEAGMDFMSALQRNCEKRKLDPLNEELIRMTREIQVGTPRRVALKNMSDRVKQPDLKSVAYALIQADELGVSIGSILRIQSEQLRSRRFDRAEKLANEAPVKMLGPLMLCIFPAVFVILLGPIILQNTGLLS